MMVEVAQDMKDIAGHSHSDAVEYVKASKMGVVADTEIAQYLDPTIIISGEENKRLRRRIYKQ